MLRGLPSAEMRDHRATQLTRSAEAVRSHVYASKSPPHDYPLASGLLPGSAEAVNSAGWCAGFDPGILEGG
jgi:hypothetical protein